jgi:hypothetical protein
MPTSLESSTSSSEQPSRPADSGWFKIAAVAAASVLAGGLAAAWWHRKTLARLRQSEENASNPEFGISGAEPPDEV